MTQPSNRPGVRLLPCPFCEKQPDSRWYGASIVGDDGYWGIECCHVHVHLDDEAEAAAAWNTRPLTPPEKPRGEIELAGHTPGPWPVVAHPPCQRWGRFWHGSTRKPHQFKLGDDGGCFEAALKAVRRYGGVLEHPADSRAWRYFWLNPPKRFVGWMPAGDGLGFTCYVEQGHYGHMSRKPTWLYAAKAKLPDLNWSKGEQRLHPVALERYGYEKARRIGMTAMVGGKDKTRIRNATPAPFRDLLISIARSAATERQAA